MRRFHIHQLPLVLHFNSKRLDGGWLDLLYIGTNFQLNSGVDIERRDGVGEVQTQILWFQLMDLQVSQTHFGESFRELLVRDELGSFIAILQRLSDNLIAKIRQLLLNGLNPLGDVRLDPTISHQL